MGRRFASILILSLLGLATPASAREVIQQRGSIAHPAAGTTFPERVGEFRRGLTVRYGDSDMSAEYEVDRPSGRMYLTVYLYPADRYAGAARAYGSAGDRQSNCSGQFNGAVAALRNRFSAAREETSEPLPQVAGTSGALSHRRIFGFETQLDGRLRPVRSEIGVYCYVGERWMVKYRVTYPVDFAGADDMLNQFILTGPWPGRSVAPDTDTVAP